MTGLAAPARNQPVDSAQGEATTGAEPAPELVSRAAGGDRSAEAELCRRFLPAVRTFARRRLRAADAVAEFSQDVMLLFLEALRRGTVEDPARLGGFVLGICRNLALDRVRQRERREALWQQFGAVCTQLDRDMPAADEPASFEIIHLEDCLSRLNQRGRDLVRLAYAESRSHGEIAATLATTEGNARVLRHRTLQVLRECMSQRITWEASAA